MTDNSKLEQYAKSQQVLFDSAQRLRTLFSQMKSESAEVIGTICEKMKDTSLKVVVLGNFKRGKSTFINSLLGDESLPNFATPCTAVINEVKWGEEKKAVVHFKAPSKKLSLKKVFFADLPEKAKEYLRHQRHGHIEPLEIGINELEDYVVIKDSEDDSADSIHDLPYDHVEIFWPLPLLKNGVVIIDSPGLDECESRTEITRRYLDKADVILFVMSCSALAGQTEMNFIDNELLSNGYEDMLFICNRFDELHTDKDRERVKSLAYKLLGPKTNFGRENGIFFLSAARALDGRMEHDEQKVAESGVTELESKLYSMLVESRGRTKLLQPARLMMKETGTIGEKMHSLGTEHLERKIKLIRRLGDYMELRNKLIPSFRFALKSLVAGIYAKNSFMKQEFNNTFDQYISESNAAIDRFSPVKTIGLFTLFSDTGVRRTKICEAATDMFPRLKQLVANQQNVLVQRYFSLIKNSRLELRNQLFLLMQRVKKLLDDLDLILHPKQVDQSQSLEGLQNAFNRIHEESEREKTFNKNFDRTEMADNTADSNENEKIIKVSDEELWGLVKVLGARDYDFFSSIEHLYTYQPYDYVGHFNWGNPIDVLQNIGFDFTSGSNTTNDIKIILRNYYTNNISSQKSMFMEQHFTGWGKAAKELARNVYRFFCDKIDEADAVAEKIFQEELMSSERTTTLSDSTLKEVSQLRAQIEETVFDLVAS